MYFRFYSIVYSLRQRHFAAGLGQSPGPLSSFLAQGTELLKLLPRCPFLCRSADLPVAQHLRV